MYSILYIESRPQLTDRTLTGRTRSQTDAPLSGIHFRGWEQLLVMDRDRWVLLTTPP